VTDETTSGPDLLQGVHIRELPDGGKLAGHAGDHAILLVRKGSDIFAVDAFCTHYHGPLAEGLVVGETIRCPWHHACFDLRTGSAACAPAMRPLRVYETVRDGDVVRVLPEPEAAAPVRVASPIEHVAIVGAGAAGSFAASELRRIGFGGRITLLTRESRLPYDKPNLSKDYLAGRAPQEWIPLRSSEEYASDGIELRLNAEVGEIDAERGELRLLNGETIDFDRLILAPGAVPRRLDIPVAEEAQVYYLRTWSDADALRAAVDRARNVVIIGSSFIGLEVAASLREHGLNVTVVAPDQRPLERVLGRDIGDFVRRTHEAHGVRFRLGRRPTEIRAGRVLLDDGSVETADAVVAGIGVVPDVALAEGAGLAVEQGIVVNEYLESSAPNIFVAGDAARFPSPRTGRPIRVEHWVAAGRQGQRAAQNAVGTPGRFAAVPFFWSQHYDLVLSYVGHAERADDVRLYGSLDEHNAAAVFRDDGRIAAVATLFRDDISLAVEAAMERNAADDEIENLLRRF
jgi:NADPH-dependent 2,4-dienoyl-CoA reductase/sulfur reductase-like enzyme/nitrite reductase/ring-hydroxylating ferredoxin subunit